MILSPISSVKFIPLECTPRKPSRCTFNRVYLQENTGMFTTGAKIYLYLFYLFQALTYGRKETRAGESYIHFKPNPYDESNPFTLDFEESASLSDLISEPCAKDQRLGVGSFHYCNLRDSMVLDLEERNDLNRETNQNLSNSFYAKLKFFLSILKIQIVPLTFGESSALSCSSLTPLLTFTGTHLDATTRPFLFRIHRVAHLLLDTISKLYKLIFPPHATSIFGMYLLSIRSISTGCQFTFGTNFHPQTEEDIFRRNYWDLR